MWQKLNPLFRKSEPVSIIKKMPEVEALSNSVQLQSKHNQSAHQLESKAEIQPTAAETSFISEPTEIGTTQSVSELTNIQASVQKLASEARLQRTQSEAEPETVLDVGINSERVKSSSIDVPPPVRKSEQQESGNKLALEAAEIFTSKPEAQATEPQFLIQKSELKPEPQAKLHNEFVPEADRVSASAPGSQTVDIQASAQTLKPESNPQIGSGIESSFALPKETAIESKLQSTDIQTSIQRSQAESPTSPKESAIESELQSTDIQTSIQQSQAESEDPVVAEARILPETIDTQKQVIPSETRASTIKPKIQALETEDVSEAANSQILEPEIQGIEVPLSIQRLVEKPEAFTADETEINQTSPSTEGSTTSVVVSSAEELVLLPDTSIEQSQTPIGSPTQFKSESVNQTSEPGTNQQIQRQLDNSNIESVDRPLLTNSQYGQASHLQPDTLDAEIALTQSSTAAPATDFSIATSNSETTVQRSLETEPSSKHLPQLPQVLQDLSVLQPLSRNQSSEYANSSLIQTKGYINDSASNGFNPVSADSTPSKSFYPEVVQPAKTEIGISLPNSSAMDSNSTVGLTDAIPSAWSSLAELMDGQTITIQRSPTQNTTTSQSLTVSNRSISGQNNTMLQAQLVESPPIQVTQNQLPTTVVARKDETAADEDAAETDYLDVIAQAIYDRLRQRMRVEQERHGRDYSGRLPW